MSAETLKFFDDKSTEGIINWMIANLTDDQIRMCLNKSGVPDTSLISKPVAEDSGAGSSTDQPPPEVFKPPPPSPSPRSARAVVNSGLNVKERTMIRYYTLCKDKGYVIKDITGMGKTPTIHYYKFEEIGETGDQSRRTVSPDSEEGDAGWVYIKEDMVSFKSRSCYNDISSTEIETFNMLKSENMDVFTNPPAEVMDAAKRYILAGLESPIPIPTSSERTVSLEISKAIKVQSRSKTWMQNNFPVLFERGLDMYPMFFIGSSGNELSLLRPVIINGAIEFKESTVNAAVVNSVLRKLTKEFSAQIDSSPDYTPTSDMREELNGALGVMGTDKIITVEFNYDLSNHPVSGFGDINYFGVHSDSDSDSDDDYSSDMIIDQPVFDYDHMFRDDPMELENLSLYDPPSPVIHPTVVSRPPSPVMAPIRPVSSVPAKKVRDMTIAEIEDRMLKMHGAKYLRDFKPEKYTTKTGFVNVKYVKRNEFSDSSAKYGDIPQIDADPIYPEFYSEFGDEGEDLLF